MQQAAAKAIDWSEQGLVPDAVIRHGIKRLLKKRLAGLHTHDCETLADQKADFIRGMNESAIAPLPFKANQQHYEVPTEFFLKVLGSQNKYSCCHWSDDTHDLDTAETEALRITCEHAGLRDGMNILELGCGWGSLTKGYAIEGLSDHTISQSLYLRDPDGNEVELFVDNPAFDWKSDTSWMAVPVKPLIL